MSVVFLVSLHFCGVGVEPPGTEKWREEYAVWSTVIDQVFTDTETKLFVVLDQTSYQDSDDAGLHKWLQGLLKRSPELAASDLFADFLVRSKRSIHLQDKFTLDTDYVLVSEEQIDELLQKDSDCWTGFHRKYPDADGLLRLSGVGFNQTRDQALVYVRVQMVGFSWKGKHVVLSKKDGQWTVRHALLTLMEV